MIYRRIDLWRSHAIHDDSPSGPKIQAFKTGIPGVQNSQRCRSREMQIFQCLHMLRLKHTSLGHCRRETLKKSSEALWQEAPRLSLAEKGDKLVSGGGTLRKMKVRGRNSRNICYLADFRVLILIPIIICHHLWCHLNIPPNILFLLVSNLRCDGNG